MNILKKIEERKEELYEILCELIRVDSQSFGNTGESREIADFIAKKFEDLGYEADVYSPISIPGMKEHPDYWAPHELENRFNVSVVIPGKDHSRRLMLASHSDTVAIGDIKNWTVDPFGGIIKDGKIWGRGACDDKYGIATALFLFKIFKDEGIVPPCDIVFTAYCNEEYGGSHGALAACLKYPCDDIINMDCKNFEIWICAVGGEEVRAHIAAQNSVDDCGVMLEGLAVLKDEFARFREKRYAELKAQPEYANTLIPDSSVRFMEMKAGNAGADLGKASAFVCYYASATREEIEIEFDEMAKRVDSRLAPMGLKFDHYEKETRFFHFGKSEKENPVVDKLISSAKEASGRTLVPCGSCQSDLSIFLKYGSKRAISFGIGRDFGTYGGAHQADEYIECDRLLEFAKIMGNFLYE